MPPSDETTRPNSSRTALDDNFPRRALLGSAGAGSLAAVAGCLESLAPGRDSCLEGLDGGCATYPADVNMFQANLDRHGYYPDETVPDSVRVDWSFPNNYVHHTAAKSSPIQTHNGNIVFAADTGLVQARSPTGQQLWSVQTEATHLGMHSSPTIVGNTAFVGGYDGAIYAIDVRDGRRRWTTTASDMDGTLAVGSSAAFHDGTLYFIAEYGSPSSGALWTLDPVDGETTWSDDRLWGQPHPSPTIDRETGHIVAGSNDGTVYAWTYPGLSFDWSYQAGGSDGPDGREKAGGEFNLGAEIKGTIAAYEGKGYVGSWDEQFHCIDLSDGSGIWTFDTGFSNMANPAVDTDEGVVYTGSDIGNIWALDPATGEELWSRDVGGRVIGAITVTAETVLVGSYDSHVYALDKHTGAVRWRVENRGRVTSAVVPIDGRLYYAERARFRNDRSEDPTFEQPGHAYCLAQE